MKKKFLVFAATSLMALIGVFGNYGQSAATTAILTGKKMALYANLHIFTSQVQVDAAVKNGNGLRMFKNNSGPFYYIRYDLLNYSYTPDTFFSGISVKHDAALSNTSVRLSKISFVNESYGLGVGIKAEGKTPFGGASIGAEVSTTFSYSETMSCSVSKTLHRNNGDGSSYDASGEYYLYFNQNRYDTILLKTKLDGTFITAVYFTDQTHDNQIPVLSRAKPGTTSGVAHC